MGLINIDVTDRKEQRNFGLIMAGALVLLGTVRWWFHDFEADRVPYILWGLAVPFLVLGLALPRALQPVFRAWIQLAEVLNFLITRLLLGTIFFLILTPIGFAMRRFSDDPMKRAWLPDAPSYWEDAEEDEETLDRFKHQF